VIGRVQNWPEGVRAAMSALRQGSLVPTPPLFFACDPATPVHELSVPSADDDLEPDEIVELADRTPFGIVTTQSCDLDKRNHAWVQLSPAYTIDPRDTNRVTGIEQGRVHHFVKLTGPELPDGFWVADFRLEVSLDKGWFVGRRAIAGFATEEEFSRLARQLGGRRARVALSDALRDTVQLPLSAWLAEDPTRFAGVSEVRVAATPSHAYARDVRLLVLTEQDSMPRELREKWDAWWDEVRPEAARRGLNLMGNLYESIATLPALRYIESAQLDLDA
jgi:hypothetical protein